jgi:hypothetical protein
MRRSRTIAFSIGLVGASVLFIILEGWTKWEFFWHLAAIPLEILIAVFIVESILERHEKRAMRRPFIHEAAKHEEQMKRTWKILTDGIKLFLDYAIEIKDKKPAIFEEMMADYELAISLRESA